MGQQLHSDSSKQSLNQLSIPWMHCQHVATFLCQMKRNPSLCSGEHLLTHPSSLEEPKGLALGALFQTAAALAKWVLVPPTTAGACQAS